MNRPWIKFYPADWRSDPRLRMCSLAARGLWMDLISYMHEGQPYGHLTIDGIMPPLEKIARLVACPIPEVKRALAELESLQVFSRSSDGAIYSRRMVRDDEKATHDAANGKRGGNPQLKQPHKRGVNPPDNGGDNTPDKAQMLEARIRKKEDGDDARARAGPGNKISPEAVLLCNELMRLQHLEIDDARCIATAHAVQAWLTKGWKAEVIRSTVEIVMARRTEAPNAIRYFEKPIATAHAELERPLPIAKIQEDCPHVARKNARPRGALDAAKDYQRQFESGLDCPPNPDSFVGLSARRLC